MGSWRVDIDSNMQGPRSIATVPAGARVAACPLEVKPARVVWVDAGSERTSSSLWIDENILNLLFSGAARGLRVAVTI
jgi:hypothetical protein